jgi:hypothetical protein
MIEYIGTAGVADITGLAYGTIAVYGSEGKLPTPDAIIKGKGAETRGWLPETIERWHRERMDIMRGRRPYVYWLENTEDNTIIILTKTMAVEDLTAWLTGACADPANTARDILSRTSTGYVSHNLSIHSARQLFTINPDLTLQDLHTCAHNTGVTCADASLAQIVAVLEHTRLEEYCELTRSYEQ